MHTRTKVDQGIVRHQFIGFQIFSSSCLMLTDHGKLMCCNKNRWDGIFVPISHSMKEFAVSQESIISEDENEQLQKTKSNEPKFLLQISIRQCLRRIYH